MDPFIKSKPDCLVLTYSVLKNKQWRCGFYETSVLSSTQVLLGGADNEE